MSGPSTAITVTRDGSAVSSLTADPVAPATYIFQTTSGVIGSPLVARSLGMTNSGNYTIPSLITTTNPMNITLPAQTAKTINNGGQVTSSSYSSYLNPNYNWYLEFTIDGNNLQSATPGYSGLHLGTTNYYVSSFSDVLDGQLKVHFTTPFYPDAYVTDYVSGQFAVRIQFLNGVVNLFVNGVLIAGGLETFAYTEQVQFSCLYSDDTEAAYLSGSIPIQNVNVKFLDISYTPSLRYSYLTSTDLIPFLTNVDLTTVRFTTPPGLISTGINAPSVVIDLGFGGESQGITASYLVVQIGVPLPPPTFRVLDRDSETIDFPSPLYLAQLVPFSYTFITTPYYIPETSTPAYTSSGATTAVITGTTSAAIQITSGFIDLRVSGDRSYYPVYLYGNNITLSIQLPFLSGSVSSANVGFGGSTQLTVLSGGLGVNAVVLNSVTISYSTSVTITFVPIGDDGSNILFSVRVGSTQLGGLVTIPYGTPLNFSMNFASGAPYSGTTTSLTVNTVSINQVTPGFSLPVFLDPFSSGTLYLLPYTSSTPTSLTVSSPSGLLSLPPSNPVVWKVSASYKGTVVSSIQTFLNVIQNLIISTPNIITNPPPSYIYTPFSAPYVFTCPTSPGSTLIFYNSDVTLRPYLSSNTDKTVVTFSAPNGFTLPFVNAHLYIQLVGPDGVIVTYISIYLTASSDIILANPPFTGSITLYKYEPFVPGYNYSLVGGVSGINLTANASSAEIRTFITSSSSSNVTFSGTYNTSYNNILNLIVSAINTSGVTVSSFSNAVSVYPGRFSTPVNTVYSFYQYEDISVTYGSNIAFTTAASLTSLPASTPALPVGLTFASVGGSLNNFVLKGIPRFQTPTNQYLILGTNTLTGQIVTTKLTLTVNPSRIVINPPRAFFPNLLIDSPITPITFTAIQPSALTILDFQYDWDTLPDGLVFTDINSNVVSQPFRPADSNLTLILSGTPTSNAAYAFVNGGYSSYTANLYAFQYQPKGVQTNQKAPITFTFGTTVLFNSVSVPPLFVNQALATNDVIIQASSYFPSGLPIQLIQASSLPNGLSISNDLTGTPNYVNGFDYQSGVYLSGTPTTVSSNVYTFTATLQSGVNRTIQLPILILQDVVSFTSPPPLDNVLTVSKPTDADHTRTFTATTLLANKTLVFTTSFDITQYGLVLTQTNNTAVISGTPTRSLSPTLLVVSAIDVLGVSASVQFVLTIQPDTFTFVNPSLSAIQNVPITSAQFSCSTASGNPVLYFSSTNLPSGLFLSPRGLLTGTPLTTASSFTLLASTGQYQGGTETYNLGLTPDSALTLLTANPLTFKGSSFSIDAFRSFTYSTQTPTLTIDPATVKDKYGNTTSRVVLSLSGTVLNGSFVTGASGYSPFSFVVKATYLNMSSTQTVQLTFNGTSGSLTINNAPGSLAFSSPSQTNYLVYQHCPIQPIVFRVSGSSGFISFYTSKTNLPVGLVFTPDPTGTLATLSGTPAIFDDQLHGITVYALNNGKVVSMAIQIRIITPFFVNPQDNGASAYTTVLRNQVVVNAAQNARDAVVFPETDASLGYLQSPGAPDVNSPPVPCIDPKRK